MMNILNKFCCCVDLRRGCLIYAWLQTVPIAIFIGQLFWLSNLIKTESTRFNELVIAGQFDLLVGIQIIKVLSTIPLSWGLIKTQHMFYEPWLFINGLENIILIIFMTLFFICGCIFGFHSIIIVVCMLLAVLCVHGCYIWSRVYIVYKRDKQPNIIRFEESLENEST